MLRLLLLDRCTYIYIYIYVKTPKKAKPPSRRLTGEESGTRPASCEEETLYCRWLPPKTRARALLIRRHREREGANSTSCDRTCDSTRSPSRCLLIYARLSVTHH